MVIINDLYNNAKKQLDAYLRAGKKQAQPQPQTTNTTTIPAWAMGIPLTQAKTTSTAQTQSTAPYEPKYAVNAPSATKATTMKATTNEITPFEYKNPTPFDYTSTLKNENADLFDRYRDEHEYLKNTNPFETETGKSVLQRYDLAGLQGRDNEAAVGGGNNTGNIDSYSSANALRQQMVLRNMGEQSALSAHQQRLEQAQTLLKNMGLNIDRVAQQDETAKNNYLNREVAAFQAKEDAKNNLLNREVLTSQVTGIVPNSMRNQENIFFNKDGMLIDPNVNYMEIINNATAQLKTETDPQQRANLQETIRQANEARNHKIQTVPGFEQYANTMQTYAAPQTATVKMASDQLGSQERIAMTGLTNAENQQLRDLEYKERMNAASLSASERQLLAELQYKREALASEEKQQQRSLGNAAAMNAASLANAYAMNTQNNALKEKELALQRELAKYSAESTTAKPTLTAAQTTSALESGLRTPAVLSAYEYYFGEPYVDNAAEVASQPTQSFDDVYTSVGDKTKAYLRTIKGITMDEDVLRNDILSRSKDYDISIADAKKILQAYGYETYWLDDYKDSGVLGLGKGIVKKIEHN